MWQKLASVAITFVLAGCSSGLSVHTDFDPAQDFSQYKTYVWAAPPKTGDPRLDSELTQRRIQAAVDSVLAGKGLRPAQGNEQPNFIMGYYAAVEGRVDVQSVGTYYGWGRGPYYGGVYPSTSTRYYNQGTLIIDVADAARKELVWRGTGESEVHQERDPERRQQRLVSVVQQIMRGFPPTK
jgi:hypothetical protein